MKNKRIWHKAESCGPDALILKPLNGQYAAPYCIFYEKDKKLVISEYGKSFDDHAVVVFRVVDIKDAEYICNKLVDVYTV